MISSVISIFWRVFEYQCLFVCLFVTMRPAGTRCICELYWHNITSFNNNSFHMIHAPVRFEPASTRDPTATHHLSLPGLRYQYWYWKNTRYFDPQKRGLLGQKMIYDLDLKSRSFLWKNMILIWSKIVFEKMILIWSKIIFEMIFPRSGF
jgi:hypothetical protein